MTTLHDFALPSVHTGDALYATRRIWSMPRVQVSAPEGVKTVLALAQGKPTASPSLEWALTPASIANFGLDEADIIDDLRALKAGEKPKGPVSFATVIDGSRNQIVSVLSPGKVEHLVAGTKPGNGVP